MKRIIYFLVILNFYCINSCYAISKIDTEVCNAYQNLTDRDNCIKGFEEKEKLTKENELKAIEAAKIKALPPKENALRNVTLNISLTKTDFGTINADLEIINNSDYIVKDIEITCYIYGKSGTGIDKNTRIIYDLIRNKESKKVDNFNMGFVNSQADSFRCGVSDLVVMQ